MSLYFTYQTDSIKDVNSLQDIIAVPETEGLKFERSAPVSLEDISIRREATHGEKAGSSLSLRKPVRQSKQNFTVGGSQYIEARNDVNLVAVVNADPGLRLPERPVNHVSYDWITLLLLLALALFASVKTTVNKYMSNLFQSIVNYSTAVRMFQEKNNSLLYAAFQLDVLFYIIFAVFVFQVSRFFSLSVPYQHFSLYLFCLALVVIYFLVQKIVYLFMGILIHKKSETGEYLFNADNFKRVAGLILLPMVAVITFYPFSRENIPVLIGIGVVVFLYSILIVRGFIILLRKQYPIFYLFLYFCTLELLPLVLLFKILVV